MAVEITRRLVVPEKQHNDNDPRYLETLLHVTRRPASADMTAGCHFRRDLAAT